ncbi:hypothetical protein HA052_08670 [Chromobacterium haemolyticum]|uniref:Uncharacterized protein n=1 Tax=Chromobacterium fluminis TaxID=3044269 RepID=A0ABX0L0C3_9NEIS|nr:hypothetical protein [Chromobacterium haemolyticum]NHR05274.1 hypothetical protein [Chromobacterium haemolyticum]
MKNTFILLIIITSNTYAGNLTKKDVKRFLENAEICQHLLGEVSGEGDAEQAIVIRNANQVCEQAKKQRKRLLLKYKHDESVIKSIKEFDETFADGQ